MALKKIRPANIFSQPFLKNQRIKKLESKLPDIENKEIAGLILSKLSSFATRPTELLVVHNFGPRSQSEPADSQTFKRSERPTIFIVSSAKQFAFNDEIVIEFDVDSTVLIQDLRYKLDVDLLEFQTSESKTILELPLRYKHKTLVLCQEWERPYFVDHSLGTDFVQAFTNKTIVASYNPSLILKDGFTEIIAMRRPELLRPFLGLSTQVQLSVFQTEQMVSNYPTYFINLIRSLGKNIRIYDYSKYNISKYSELQCEFHWLPVDTPEKNYLKNLYDKTAKKYDFAHVGKLTNYRLKLIEDLKNQNFTVNCIQLWGLKRDLEIAKCRALLNLHQEEDFQVFEQSRCNRFLDVMPIYSQPSLEQPESVKSIDSLKNNLIILFACYNPENAFNENHQNYIKYLLELPHKEIVVLSTSSSIERLSHWPESVVVVNDKNEDLDFGLWFRYLAKRKSSLLSGIYKLLLVNDSCEALQSFLPMYTRMQSNEYWGITDSFEYNHHLQSYWLGFMSSAAIKSFFMFFDSCASTTGKDKKFIIIHREIALSVYMAKKGHKLNAAFPCTKFTQRITNVSYYFYKELCALGCPLQKHSRNK